MRVDAGAQIDRLPNNLKQKILKCNYELYAPLEIIEPVVRAKPFFLLEQTNVLVTFSSNIVPFLIYFCVFGMVDP